MSLRIAFFSNSPTGTSGYSSQTALIAPRLKSRLGHEVAIIASHNQGGYSDWNGIPIYPIGRMRGSQDTIGPFSEHFGADITIAFLDAFVHDPKQWANSPGLRFCPLFPVDHEPVPHAVLNVVAAPFTWQPLCYSRHGYRATCATGLTPRYLPHGFDPAIYYRPEGESIAEIRRTARRNLGFPPEAYLSGSSGDPFVVGMVAANNDPLPSRKAWAESFEGFALFRQAVLADNPNAEVWLYVHTWLDGQVNLRRLAGIFGIAENLIVCPEVGQRLGFDGAVMRDTYASFDVLLMPSHGEGFGLPLLEAQAVGTPVITGDWTAMSELFHGGVLIPKSGALRVMDLLESYQWYVKPQAVCDALMEMYGKRLQDSRSARLYSDLAQLVHGEYRIDDVLERYWKPVLEEMEGRVRRENADAAEKSANAANAANATNRAMYTEGGQIA